ncbi:uncharacterized protein P174DRAFT_455272 [Aspergillus novofumigatus IBT 16806]|uniref:Uncharacterized protein n=1 Tax=Aspergillus novofumigatus (strain IBT 16806) TaxID=1392255 RepID=A0A2I1BUN8_ASPN1|nr:uncharacterized protein P174DRAFT_455272 [Aspergillus novofumigatus IBT 16806]PKX89076.1 hypothetical protein P174DRAFT_455272 [Aspergillus novofumigatus IBT 16806]
MAVHLRTQGNGTYGLQLVGQEGGGDGLSRRQRVGHPGDRRKEEICATGDRVTESCPQVQATFVQGRRQPHAPSKVDVGNPQCGPCAPGVPGNETLLPDGVLLRCLPAFLIWHPALKFPSYYRVMLSFEDGDRQKLEKMTNDFGGDLHPAVDAHAPELLRHFCDVVGLNASKIRFEWEAVDQEKLTQDPVRMRTRATLMTSSGIMPCKTFRGLSAEDEAVKWRAEFRGPVATRLQQWQLHDRYLLWKEEILD